MTDSSTINDSIAHAQRIKAKYEIELRRKKNVVGVGIGVTQTPDGETIAIMVNVAQKEPRSKLAKEDIIPHRLDDIPVKVVETGTIRAF